MTVANVAHLLEELAPKILAEDFDNVGLLVGDMQQIVTNVLVTLDTTEAVLEEAIQKQCNLIVTFHPVVFSGLKKISNTTFVERVVTKAIKNNIAIYAIHTNLDNAEKGTNYQICQQLGLVHQKVLIPKEKWLQKLVAYVPFTHVETVRNALFEAGAGAIGNYTACSFNQEGIGTFVAGENARPFVGNLFEIHQEKETAVSVIIQKHYQNKVIEALLNSHPYEEVAYDFFLLFYPFLFENSD